MWLEATAFDNPVIVTAELSVTAKFASVTIVTVIVFDCPVRELLWPIFFVVKDAVKTVEQEKHKTSTKIPTSKNQRAFALWPPRLEFRPKNDRRRRFLCTFATIWPTPSASNIHDFALFKGVGRNLMSADIQSVPQGYYLTKSLMHLILNILLAMC